MGVQITYSPNQSLETIHLPGSKSQSNRYLVLQALSGYITEIHGLSEARDTQVLQSLLHLVMQGSNETLELDCQDGGAPLRFIMAVCAMIPGKYLIKGTDRLMERPQQDLVSSLSEAGANIQSLGMDEKGPWLIEGGMMQASRISVSIDKSSQYASALMLIAPYLGHPMEIELQGQGGSEPYIAMTLAALGNFGVIYQKQENTIRIWPGFVAPEELAVEADWSAAAFFFAASVKANSAHCFFPHLTLPSIQGDSFLENIFRYEGWECLSINKEEVEGLVFQSFNKSWTPGPLSLNLSNYPDLAPALVVYYMMMGREIDFYGLESLAGKESVRDEVLGEMVRACGASWEVGDGVWRLRGKITQQPKILNTHDDHRMAMAFSLLAMHFGAVDLSERLSVEKSFPRFWHEMKQLGIV